MLHTPSPEEEAYFRTNHEEALTPEEVGIPVANNSDCQLKISLNTKTSQIVLDRTDGRASAYPKLPNSFGLPAGRSCPGATDEFCAPYCYGVESEGRTNVRNNLARNLEILLGKSEDEMYELLKTLIAQYQVGFDKACLPAKENVFRIHWDGDFFSVDYARAWARVICENPQIKFWVYTRSFRAPVDVIPELVGIKNLALYMSVDAGNIDDAITVHKTYGQKVGMAFCAEDEYYATLLAEKAGKVRTTTCPENIGKLALASGGKGACVNCMLCPNSRPNILFVHKKSPKEVPGQQDLGFLGILEPDAVKVEIRSRQLPKFEPNSV